MHPESSLHHICVATAPKPIRKGWRRGEGDTLKKIEAEHPSSFVSFDMVPVPDHAAMHRLINDLLDQPTKMIVLGRAVGPSGPRSRHTFEDEPTCWWFIDVDDAEARPDESDAEAIRRLLPFLEGKAFVYAYSGSRGFKSGLRVRVICRIDGRKQAELKAWARELNNRIRLLQSSPGVDEKIYQASRVIYTARPYLDGVDDPCGERAFLVEGDESPVEPEMPEMVLIEQDGGIEPLKGFPKLPGDWTGGEGSNRSQNALIGLGWLKTYLGPTKWKDPRRRKQGWERMLKEANASPDSLRRYGDFIDRRWLDAEMKTGGEPVAAIANVGNELPLAEAEARHRAIIANVIRRAEPGVYCINAPLGIGKTTAVIEELKHFIYRSGDGFTRHDEANVDFFAPTTDLCEEIEARAVDAGVPCFTERGRARATPSGHPVCYKWEAVKKLEGAVDSVAAFVCKSGDQVCPFFEGPEQCHWQWQRRDTLHLPLRIRPHSYLPLKQRGEQHDAYRRVDMVIIDEQFVEKMLHVHVIGISDLLAARDLSEDVWDRIYEFVKVARRGLTVDALSAAGFDEAEFKALAKAEAELQPQIALDPAMSIEQSIKAVEELERPDEANWMRLSTLWRQLGKWVANPSPNRVRMSGDAIVLAWRSKVEAIPWDSESNRPRVPVIILSATMRRRVIEQLLPVDEWYEIEAQKHPGARLAVREMRGSKSEGLAGVDDEDETEEARIEEGKRARETILAAYHEAKARNPLGAALITYKKLQSVLKLPKDDTAHFKNLEGIDRFKGRDVVVYGRTLPSPIIIENQTRALYCDDQRPIFGLTVPWFPRQRVQLRGQQAFVWTERHPDPRVEDVRWMTSEGEVMQALGRARYLRHPSHMTLLNRMALPLTVDDIGDTDLPMARMRRSRVLPKTVSEAQRLFGFGHRDTVKSAYDPEAIARRGRFIEVAYRRPGARGPAIEAYVDGVDVSAIPFPVTSARIVDSEHNHEVVRDLNRRELAELAELLARHPGEAQEGTIGSIWADKFDGLEVLHVRLAGDGALVGIGHPAGEINGYRVGGPERDAWSALAVPRR